MTSVVKDPWFRNRKIRDGIYRAIERRMEDDRSIILLGEGAHMKIHFDAPSIEKKFPDRVVTMPISEDGNTNFAVGLALGGAVPIVDVISSDFLYRTFDSIANTCRTVNYVADAPYTIIIRAEFLTGGPTSGQRIEGLFCGIPGIHVAVPSRPEDAEAMMAAALNRKGVTIFFEDRMIEDATTPSDAGETPRGLGATFVRRWERDGKRRGVTVVSYGLMARQLETWLSPKDPVDLIDLRWLAPLDIATVRESTRQTGALLVVESGTTEIIGGRLIAAMAELSEEHLRTKWMACTHATIPACRDLHEELFPTRDAVRAHIAYLDRFTREVTGL